MEKDKEPQAINNEDAYQHLLNLEKVSGIARKALKCLISQNKPAIPPYYEKIFYNVAMEMGENKLITHLMSSVPTGQAATIMVEGVSTIITNLNRDIRQYQEGIDRHGGQLKDRHEDIKKLLDPAVWKLVEKNLIELRIANDKIKKRLIKAEDRLKSQELQVGKLQRKIRSDPLTGVMNRLAMEEDLSDELSRCKRYGRTFGIVMIDIDHFKKINDTHGHTIGDEALKAFAQTLRKCLREVDVIYRYGGEEFLVLLPETEGKNSLITAERLRKMIESQVFKYKNDPSLQLRLTASFGVSVFLKGDSDYLDIIKRADQALYMAKNNGRNRVENNIDNQ
ncbi:MAG: GGDEF domain-containing protein [Desulfobulbaceae bacterium]|nr:GGDEF domain-containing protein [Desulfobulbaceae bacterium]